MGINFKWDITYRCNLNCNHCVNGNFLNQTDQELSTEGVKKVIDRLSDIDTDYVHLLGGEPTFRKDFYEIMDYFGEKKRVYN
ncbi:hypothetical protein BBF96_04420 [Anoxybacter fermentans]|uniref:Radical SAM core domain-containing protein n=1 Tax=Anoxybacter fermentans TaxID=1323375 RepID=A0A3S9SWN4_9FIRM|nr:radical SAM protein [Anoxybacter fermentans]AZR72701.1 hypothetical protein BBF96_04420 [Anoxybacter fermentans]